MFDLVSFAPGALVSSRKSKNMQVGLLWDYWEIVPQIYAVTCLHEQETGQENVGYICFSGFRLAQKGQFKVKYKNSCTNEKKYKR